MGKHSKKEKGQYASASTHLTLEEMRLVEEEAEEKEWSVSKVIRKAVRKYFGLEDKPKKTRRETD